jgi:hypothetical protein
VLVEYSWIVEANLLIDMVGLNNFKFRVTAHVVIMYIAVRHIIMVGIAFVMPPIVRPEIKCCFIK